MNLSALSRTRNLTTVLVLAGAVMIGLFAIPAISKNTPTFGPIPDEVLEIWATAIVEAGVRRAIWVGRRPNRAAKTPETALIEIDGRSPPDIAAEVGDFDDRPLL